MRKVTAADVKAHRERTGCGLLQAKRELTAKYRERDKKAMLRKVEQAGSIEDLKEILIYLLS